MCFSQSKMKKHSEYQTFTYQIRHKHNSESGPSLSVSVYDNLKMSYQHVVMVIAWG